MALQLPTMTPYQQLIEIRLGGDLAGYITRGRAAGTSWRRMAADIEQRTGLKVSRETLRGWVDELGIVVELSEQAS
jgi:hypothetical protein